MFSFILSMWVGNGISESNLRSYCPIFITENERDIILATPKISK